MANSVLVPVLADAMVRVGELAAIAASTEVGRGNEERADRAAVDAMRAALNAVDMQGTIVIGEGERDEAPMLFIGEDVGTGNGPGIDVALDPLEGTTLTAKAMANALAVIAIAPRGGLLHAPDTYMQKIAIGGGYEPGIIDLDASPSDNIKALASAKGVAPEHITACVLDRPRHTPILNELRELGCRVALISDGDVAGVINTTDRSTGIDIYIGSGGAPEGVLAAAALKCAGGQMQSRLLFRNEDERKRAAKIGITDLNRKYDLDDMVSSETVFVATGVTDGGLVDGVRYEGGYVHVHSLVMSSADQMIRKIRSQRKVT